MPDRKIIKAAISPASKVELEKLSEHLSMKEGGIAGRALDWFFAQDEELQYAVLGLAPQKMKVDVAHLFMQRLLLEREKGAKGKGGK